MGRDIMESYFRGGEKEMNKDCNTASLERSRKVNCDEEAWLKQRISAAFLIAMYINKVGSDADRSMKQSTMDGLVNGLAVAVIKTLNMEPEYANLKPNP